MKQKNIDINEGKDIFKESELNHIVYDLSIEDLDERKKKAKVFDNANQVASYIGCGVETVWKNRIPKKKVKGINGKMYAIRILTNS